MLHSQHSKTRDLIRAGARGLVGAMAMTGIRTLTGNVGLVEETPPEAIVGKHAPEPVQRLPVEHRTAFTEAAHWSYGALAGLGYNVLPRKIRSLPWFGPAYGLIIWLVFEVVVAPLLAVRPTRRRLLGRLVIALDHAVYGIVVAGRLAPDPDAVQRPAAGRRRSS
ncbi:hypothetical protein ACWDKQ_32920 [Saccharopolyspora sp. NPDC000995]